MTKPFVHLRVRTAYTLSGSTVRVDGLIKACRGAGMPAVAMTDVDNMIGAMTFSKAAAKKGIQPILGADLLLTPPKGTGLTPGRVALIASNETGWKNLVKIVGAARLYDGPEPTVLPEMIEGYSAGVICLTGGPDGPLNRRIASALREGGRLDPKDLEPGIEWMRRLFGDRLFLELQRYPDQMGRISTAALSQENALIDLGDRHSIPLVATNDVRFLKKEDHKATKVLMSIGAKTNIHNIEGPQLHEGQYLRSGEEMAALFADLPDAVANATEVARMATYMQEPRKPKLPPFPGLPAGSTEAEHLRKVAHDGLTARLAKIRKAPGFSEKDYRDRLDFEISVIERMKFPGYFLIVADFIQWAKDHGIAVGPGRGSGAGSLVAYALKITDLDPLRYGLYFERFLNPERVSMPDFDIDFEQDRREKVMDYVRDRYSAVRVAQIGTIGKLQARAAVRAAGRGLGLPHGMVDRWAKLVPENPAAPVTLEQAVELDPLMTELKSAQDDVKDLFSIALKIEGMYSHASSHAAGVVISDAAVSDEIPVFKDKKGNAVTQYDMKGVEDAGLVKFDFLGLKTLDVILLTCRMLEKRDITIDFDEIGVEDAPTYAMIDECKTYGVFQLESAGMRRAIRQMGITDINDIIALVSLYRPGPMAEIPKYGKVKAGEMAPDYSHEVDGRSIPFSPKSIEILKPILEPTYGVIIYQEQVMQIGQQLAGYTLGGADMLRRAMGKKIKAEMDAQRAVFLKGCKEQDIDDQSANLIFDKVAKFADYGFNKSHAAAYAMVSYQTAYLRCHHFPEFIAANCTVERDNSEKVARFLAEARAEGLEILPPDINQSLADFSVEKSGKSIRFGLGGIADVSDIIANAIEQERTKNGLFRGLGDFLARMATREDGRGINKKVIHALAASGAFDRIYPNTSDLVHEKNLEYLARWVGQVAKADLRDKKSGQVSMFEMLAPEAATENVTVDLDEKRIDRRPKLDEIDRLQLEYEALGTFITGHPVDRYREILEKTRAVTLDDLISGRTNKGTVGCFVFKKTQKITRTRKALLVVNISDPSGHTVEGVCFGDDVAKVEGAIREGEMSALSLRATERDGEVSLIINGAQSLKDLAAEARRQETGYQQAAKTSFRPARQQSLGLTDGSGERTVAEDVGSKNGRDALFRLAKVKTGAMAGVSNDGQTSAAKEWEPPF